MNNQAEFIITVNGNEYELSTDKYLEIVEFLNEKQEISYEEFSTFESWENPSITLEDKLNNYFTEIELYGYSSCYSRLNGQKLAVLDDDDSGRLLWMISQP